MIMVQLNWIISWLWLKMPLERRLRMFPIFFHYSPNGRTPAYIRPTAGHKPLSYTTLALCELENSD